jgi:hypothetical protein
MKPASIAALLVSAVLTLPQFAYACGSGKREPMPNVRYYPISNSVNHWPAETTVDVGSIISFLTPADAKVELNFQQKGMSAPLTIFGEQSHEQMRSSPDLSPRWVDIAYDMAKLHWVHIYAGSFGVTEIRMSAPDWSKQMKVTSYYRSPLQSSVPPKELVLDGNTRRTVSVDPRDDIEVTLPGTVADGWSASPESETGFRLLRVVQVWKQGTDPQVKLFLYGSTNQKNSTMVLRRSHGNSPSSFEFDIQARPAVAC